jgi:RNA polymerase sigma factor (sigma-70 family)
VAADSSTELQQLIDRVPSGDSAVRRELLARSFDRLRRLTAKMLGESFPRLQAGHDLDSVVNETWIRLVRALDQTSPATVQEFFSLAAHKIRQVLLDMARQQTRLDRRNERELMTDDSAGDSALQQDTRNPLQLSMWTEFHNRVPNLPDDERQMFEMHYYLEVPQVEIARLMNITPRQASRLWVRALERLTEGFAEIGEFV